MKNVVIFIGTRPEAIKMAPVIKAFKENYPKIRVSTILTGQHQSLINDGLYGFNLQIDDNLHVSNIENDLRQYFAVLITSITSAIDKFQPDLILVHGDTSSAAAASIAGHLSGVSIGHIEAGLRSFNLKSPWPEESNRRIIDSISSILFAPTEFSASQIPKDLNNKIFVTGNTVIDALKEVLNRINSDQVFLQDMKTKYASVGDNFILVTQHRRESFGHGHEEVLEAVRTLASEKNPIIFPVHPNPAIRNATSKILSNTKSVHLIDPVPYPEFVYLMTQARIAISDSGGIQEEAPAIGLPLLITRDVTERPEALSEETNILVGTNYSRIIEIASKFLAEKRTVNQGIFRPNVFGDGTAGLSIAKYCSYFLDSN